MNFNQFETYKTLFLAEKLNKPKLSLKIVFWIVFDEKIFLESKNETQVLARKIHIKTLRDAALFLTPQRFYRTCVGNIRARLVMLVWGRCCANRERSKGDDNKLAECIRYLHNVCHVLVSFMQTLHSPATRGSKNWAASS